MRDDLVSTTPLSSGSASDNKEFSGIEAQVVALMAHDWISTAALEPVDHKHLHPFSALWSPQGQKF